VSSTVQTLTERDTTRRAYRGSVETQPFNVDIDPLLAQDVLLHSRRLPRSTLVMGGLETGCVRLKPLPQIVLARPGRLNSVVKAHYENLRKKNLRHCGFLRSFVDFSETESAAIIPPPTGQIHFDSFVHGTRISKERLDLDQV
jgi:hypothetical protein